MISLAIDNNKRELLQNELKSDFPSLTDKELKMESVEDLIASLSLVTQQDENKIAEMIDRKLEYIGSKSL